ncbi:MAG: porin [Salinivirgaceae bacterium]|nr:porin [Salinivirgaceae bacterium]
MNRILAFQIATIIICSAFGLSAQEKKESWTDKGQVYGTIFANFHSELSNTEGEKGFEVKRAYLGYKIKIDEHFSGNIKLDIGSPDDVSEYSLKKRFAYFKNAYLQYEYQNLKVQFGIANCKQFNVQEKFWGYRYVYKSFQDQNKFGPSADIGLFAGYKVNDILSIDAAYTNGEGYSTTQADNDFKASFGLTTTPIKQVTIRLYYDSFTSSEFKQSTVSSFIGIKHSILSVGGEYSYQINNAFEKDHNIYGFSVFGTVNPIEKIKIFARYDQVYSNIIVNDIPWNLANNGSSIISGVEYSPISKVNLSINYQDWLAYASDGTDKHFIYFNLQYSF